MQKLSELSFSSSNLKTWSLKSPAWHEERHSPSVFYFKRNGAMPFFITKPTKPPKWEFNHIYKQTGDAKIRRNLRKKFTGDSKQYSFLSGGGDFVSRPSPLFPDQTTLVWGYAVLNINSEDLCSPRPRSLFGVWGYGVWGKAEGSYWKYSRKKICALSFRSFARKHVNKNIHDSKT